MRLCPIQKYAVGINGARLKAVSGNLDRQASAMMLMFSPLDP
jgi:hypothetical protein